MQACDSSPAFVVGLGASAGGLEALELFFAKAPPDSGGSFVVVMHLSRDFKSLLDELLARHTKMVVKPVVDGARLEPNTVYVIQPATELEVVGSAFRVTARSAWAQTTRVSSIDLMLRSLATSWGEHSAAVILSGSGTDGAQGSLAVQAAGGLVFAQSPESSKFDSMPIAAIATNSVSAVDTPENLAALVVDSIMLPRLAIAQRQTPSETSALHSILATVVGASHLDASQYTRSIFERRVQRRLKELQLNSLEEYATLVQTDHSEARALSETLLIGVTDFFRDEAVFNSLARQVAPEIIHRAHAENRSIRIWVPGCASGEEAYSIAIVFAEASADYPTPVDIQIFATDVHKGLLAEAARGEYSTERMQNVSDERRSMFFTRSSPGSWQIDPSIRRCIVFAPHDVLLDPPFTRLDLVSCRNVLIYFSVEAQQKVIGAFAFGLLEKCFLLLGTSETVGAQRESFDFIDVRRRIFRRTRAASRIPALRQGMDLMERRAGASALQSRRSAKVRESILQPAYAAVLKMFAPPSFLVSAERELLHTFGESRRFLRAAEGVVRYDVTDMCDNALRAPMAAGIDRSIRERTDVVFFRIELASFPIAGMNVELTIRPLVLDAEAVYALVIIKEISVVKPLLSSDAPLAEGDGTSSRIVELEIEIERTREALQSTIEEIEAANEELQATNEQLMSSNEELQSTNEELSSLNEELHSVNAEHFRQNNEHVRLTRDFEALLRATEIGVLFFDEQLNIRRFTTMIADLFNFNEGDIGRSLRTFRSPFADFDLEAFLNHSLLHVVTAEAESLDGNAMRWQLRAVPYPDQKGVVLSVISISMLREGPTASLNMRERVLNSASPYIGDAVIAVSPETGHVEYANRAAWLKFGIPEAPEGGFAISRMTPELGDSSWTSWLSTMNPGAAYSKLDVQIIDRDADVFPVDISAAVVLNGDRKHAVLRLIENKDRRRAVQELQERARNFAISNRELEQFASVVAHDLRAPLRHLNQFADILISELGEVATPSVREYLNIIQSSAASMSGMIERLLEYARIGAGAPRFADVSLHDCIDHAAEFLRDEMTASGASLEIGKLPVIKGDRSLLLLLFQNLLMNSLKYRRKDVDAKVTVAARSSGGFNEIIFSDNGLGIDPEHQETIFKMFTRLHSSSEYSGHGMGLAICRRVCEIHGGSINVDPKFSGGARFVIRLPRTQSKPARVRNVK
jgi:two-component system CheB/CheR fusion protein